MRNGIHHTTAVRHREVNIVMKKAQAIADRCRTLGIKDKRLPQIETAIATANEMQCSRNREILRPRAFRHAVVALNLAEELEDHLGISASSSYAASEVIGLISRTLRIEMPPDQLSVQARVRLDERNAALLQAQRGTLGNSDPRQRRRAIRAARYALAITHELRADGIRPASASTPNTSASVNASRASSGEPQRGKPQKQNPQRKSKNVHRGSRGTIHAGRSVDAAGRRKGARTDDMQRDTFGLRAGEVERLRKNAREQLPSAAPASGAVHRNPRAVQAANGVGRVVSGGLPGTAKGH